MKLLELHRSPARARLIEMERVQGGRVCRKCEAWKPLSEFVRDKGRPSGRDNRCRGCHRLRVHLYLQANGDRVRERKRLHYQADPEKHRERSRLYVQNNRDKVSRRRTLRRLADLEGALERERIARKSNREALRERARRQSKNRIRGGASHKLPWLAGEDDVLIEGGRSAAELAVLLGRSENAIASRRKKLREKGLMT